MTEWPILEAQNVTLRYHGMKRNALDEVSLIVHKGETWGLVGESGSGKSSLARCLVGLEAVHAGRVLTYGTDVRSLDHSGRAKFRRSVQMVFQDPLNSLNGRMTIRTILTEVLNVHRLAARAEVPGRIAGVLGMVGLGEDIADRYPHELSGGQRQRACIARALLLNPEVLIADEPVSALDVSVQAQILNLLAELVRDTGITLILIAHDLAVVRYVCEKVAVMRKGIIVEHGCTESVLTAPSHPYTRELLAAVPEIEEMVLVSENIQ